MNSYLKRLCLILSWCSFIWSCTWWKQLGVTCLTEWKCIAREKLGLIVSYSMCVNSSDLSKRKFVCCFFKCKRHFAKEMSNRFWGSVRNYSQKCHWGLFKWQKACIIKMDHIKDTDTKSPNWSKTRRLTIAQIRGNAIWQPNDKCFKCQILPHTTEEHHIMKNACI